MPVVGGLGVTGGLDGVGQGFVEKPIGLRAVSSIVVDDPLDAFLVLGL